MGAADRMAVVHHVVTRNRIEQAQGRRLASRCYR
jgi:hypothetical protein